MKINIAPITPKKNLLNPDLYQKLIAQAVLDTKDGVKADFQKTAATWTHQPKWFITRRGTDWWIGTKDEIYAYVDLGTPPHIIAPKREGGRLRFYRSGFKPKSRVGYIDSYAGKTASKDLTWAKLVHHPGTKARHFSLKIAAKWQKEFAKRCRAAVKQAAT